MAFNPQFMSEAHKSNLLNQRQPIVEHTDAGALMTPLLQARVLTRRQKDRILSCPTAEEKVEALLDILPTLPDSAYDHFVDALRSTNQGHIAALLAPIVTQQTVQPPSPPVNPDNRQYQPMDDDD